MYIAMHKRYTGEYSKRKEIGEGTEVSSRNIKGDFSFTC